MSEYPKTIELPRGDKLTLRPAKKGDEEALHEFFCGLPDEDRMFLKHDVTDRQVIKGFMAELDSGRVFPLTARQGDTIVGHATLHRDKHGWSQHVGEVRVVVAHACQGKGIAQALVRELVNYASSSGVDLVEARVLEGQLRAQHVLEGLGFEIDAVLPKRGTDRTGRRRNILVLVNDVKELWRLMQDLLDADMGTPHSGRY